MYLIPRAPPPPPKKKENLALPGPVDNFYDKNWIWEIDPSSFSHV